MPSGPAVTLVAFGGLPIMPVDDGAPLMSRVDSGGIAVSYSATGTPFVVEGGITPPDQNPATARDRLITSADGLNSYSTNFTLTYNSLVVKLYAINGSDTVPTVAATFDGVAMTQIGLEAEAVAGTSVVAAFALRGAHAGTKALAITTTGGSLGFGALRITEVAGLTSDWAANAHWTGPENDIAGLDDVIEVDAPDGPAAGAAIVSTIAGWADWTAYPIDPRYSDTEQWANSHLFSSDKSAAWRFGYALSPSGEGSNLYRFDSDNSSLFSPNGAVFQLKGASITTIGTAWTSQASAADVQWFDVAWAPSLNLFCAVALTGTNNGVMTSPDGITWTTRVPAANNAWRAICWSPDLSLFAVSGSTGTGNRLMTSPDGINWTIRTSTADNSWVDIAWSPSLALFCTVAQSVNRAMTSPTGVTWTQRTTASSATWTSICWADTLGMFVAVGTNAVQTSVNGTAWVLQTAQTGTWTAVTWSHELGLLVAVASGTAPSASMTSPDGVTWTLHTGAIPTGGCTGVTWAASIGLFVATSTASTNSICTSPDGIFWTRQTTPTSLNSSTWRNLCWSPQLSKLVAVASAGTAGHFVMSAP